MTVALVRTTPLPPANFNERLACAFIDLEGTIRDIDRMAKIASSLSRDADGGTKDEAELAAFAYQTEEMTKQMVAHYYRLFENARKAVQS